MPMSSHLLKSAIGLWQRGHKEQARKILEAVIYNDRQNESAWIWYIYTQETNKEKIAALENFLTIFPDHSVGRKALANLQAEERAGIASQDKAPKIVQSEKQSSQATIPPGKQVRPVQKSTPRGISWFFILSGICILLVSAVSMISRNNSLRSENENLMAANRLISNNLDQLNREYEALNAENGRLINEYNSLTAQYNAINNEYSLLLGNYNSLTAEHNNLVNTYNSLLNEYNDTAQSYSEFKQTAIAPPYIYIHGREVHLAFLTPDQTVYTWKVPFDSLEYDLQRGNYERHRATGDLTYPRLSLTNMVNGETYRVIDYRRFVDPSSFTAFSRYFYDRASSDDEFIYEIWYIVAQLTAYSNELNDTPRYPLETLLAGGGDCEDHAILFASMILAAAPDNWKVDLVYMDSDNPSAPQTVNHMIVSIDTGDRYYTIEATGKEFMEPYTSGVVGWHSEVDN